MKCAMLFALVVAAAATQAPVISLDLSTLEDFERLTNHKSKTLGLEVNNKNVGAYQDYHIRSSMLRWRRSALQDLRAAHAQG